MRTTVSTRSSTSGEFEYGCLRPTRGNWPDAINLGRDPNHCPANARTIDLAVGERSSGPILRRSADSASTAGPPIVGCTRSVGGQGSAISISTCSGRRSSWPLDAGVPLRDVQLAARHADPRTTTVYDHRRQGFDRHAAYVVVAFVARG